MAALNTLGVDNLSLRGVNSEYNRISRFFKTRAEAEAALADMSWQPTIGVKNACFTADEGILVFDEVTNTLSNADSATRAYIDQQIASVIGDAPELLDTLNELAAAMGDDPNFLATLSNRLDNLDVNQTVMQADIDQNEADSDAAEAALSARLDVLEADPTTETYVDAADTALGGRIDNVELTYATKVELGVAEATLNTSINDAITSANNGDAALDARIDVLEADPTTKTYVDTAIATAQADVDQNEADADAAIAAVQADVDQNESDADAAIAALQADVDQNEADSDAAEAAIVDGTTNFTGFTLQGTAVTTTGAELNFVDGVTSNIQTQLNAIQADVDQNEADADSGIAALQADVDQNEADADAAIAAVQADVDQNEADADAAIALKADIASPTFTGTPAAPTASAGTDTTQIATTAFVTAAVAALDAGALRTLLGIVSAANDGASGLAQGEMYFNTTSNTYVLVA